MTFGWSSKHLSVPLLVLAWFAIAGVQHANAAAETAGRYSEIAESYRQRDAAIYFVQLRSFYLQLEHAKAEQVLSLTNELARSCAKSTCDGLQPVALALADRLANLPQVSEGAAAEALAPIFVSGKFPGKFARNFTLPVWNSNSLIIRNVRADAVQAMFERRAALVSSGNGKVPMNRLLALGAMQLDFCELSYLTDAPGNQLGDREAKRHTACDKLAIEGVNATSKGVPAQSTGPIVDAVTASSCASVEVQSGADAHLWQRASELAQECFSTRAPGDRHSVADAPFDMDEAFKLMGGTADENGREWREVRVYREEAGSYVGHAYATDQEMALVMKNPGLLLVDPKGQQLSPDMIVSPNLHGHLVDPTLPGINEEPHQSSDSETTDPDDSDATSADGSADAPSTGTGAPPPAPEPALAQGNNTQLPGGGERSPSGEACEELSNQLGEIGAAAKGSAPRVVDLSAGRPANPMVVNPHPESPWDQSGSVDACSSWIDPQQGDVQLASDVQRRRSGLRMPA